MAFYTAAVERLLEDESMLLSGQKNPQGDRQFIDGLRVLTDCFTRASYGLKRRLERGMDRMDNILAKAGSPPPEQGIH
jgi:hypothetical protein